MAADSLQTLVLRIEKEREDARATVRQLTEHSIELKNVGDDCMFSFLDMTTFTSVCRSASVYVCLILKDILCGTLTTQQLSCWTCESWQCSPHVHMGLNSKSAD